MVCNCCARSRLDTRRPRSSCSPAMLPQRAPWRDSNPGPTTTCSNRRIQSSWRPSSGALLKASGSTNGKTGNAWWTNYAETEQLQQRVEHEEACLWEKGCRVRPLRGLPEIRAGRTAVRGNAVYADTGLDARRG